MVLLFTDFVTRSSIIYMFGLVFLVPLGLLCFVNLSLMFFRGIKTFLRTRQLKRWKRLKIVNAKKLALILKEHREKKKKLKEKEKRRARNTAHFTA